jgi:ribosome-binding factor A
VAEEIKKELADIIRNNMKDPRVKGLVSVTHVDVSRDISTATVYISSLGSMDEQNDMVKAIKQAGGYIRGELSNRMNLRFIPELVFKIDHSIQTGARINQLLNEQKAEQRGPEREKEAEGQA